jgi:malonyl-CoA O-methyltransferase
MTKSLGFNKKIVKNNFSAASQNYDELAWIQKLSAQMLCDNIFQNSVFQDKIKSGQNIQILDLGSGTGFLSEEFRQNFQQNITIFELDLALEMLRVSRDKIAPGQVNQHFVKADFEKLPFRENSFDLIISSFALQWISDLTGNFGKFYHLLKKGGIFAFAIPAEKSLSILKSASLESGCNFTFNDFPTIVELKKSLQLSGFGITKLDQEMIDQKFSSGTEALKFIKKIGANYQTKLGNRTTKTQLAAFNEICLKKYGTVNFMIDVPWQIAFGFGLK